MFGDQAVFHVQHQDHANTMIDYPRSSANENISRTKTDRLTIYPKEDPNSEEIECWKLSAKRGRL